LTGLANPSIWIMVVPGGASVYFAIWLLVKTKTTP
jgi:hypothetical protein